MNTAIEKKEPQNLIGFLSDHADDFKTVMPRHLSKDRMMRMAMSAIRTNDKLVQCSIQSVAVSLMGCSALGLEPNTPQGHAYLVPYWCKVSKKGEPDKYGFQCQLIVGYKGMIELFYRSGAVNSINVTPVFEGDEFHVELGLRQNLVHKPGDGYWEHDPAKLTHCYVVIDLKGTDKPLWAVIGRQQIENSRARSKSGSDNAKYGASGPWVTDYVAMAKKTAVRNISPFVPFSVDAANAAAYESARERGEISNAVLSLGEDAYNTTQELVGKIEEETVEASAKVDPLENRIVPPQTLSGAQQRVVDLAKEKWGDDAMIKISKMCRTAEPHVNFHTATGDDLEWLQCEIETGE